MLDALSILLALAAGFVWLNHRVFQFSQTIAMTLAGLATSLVAISLSFAGFGWVETTLINGIEQIDFGATMMNVVIGVLLYIAALKLDLRMLAREHSMVLMLACAGTLITTFLTGGAVWLALSWIGYDLPLIVCLIFGALISPTDPIATVAILKAAGLPKELETLIEGESLLNDGVGAVLFAVFLGIFATGAWPEAGEVGAELAREVFGGLIGGVVLGAIAGYLARTVSGTTPWVFLSLAVVFLGGYIARDLHLSYPLMMVAAGVAFAIVSPTGNKDSDAHIHFWKTVEDVVIAALFLALGLMVVQPSQEEVAWGAIALVIPAVLLCRYVSVALTMLADGRARAAMSLPGLLTWGGLRGGISVALALSVPAAANAPLMLYLTYGVVMFSVLVQAPTISRLFPAASLNQIVAGLNPDHEATKS